MPGRATNDWTLWVVAVSCALHVAEGYFTGWQRWAAETLGIAMPTTLFLLANAMLIVAALYLAGVGWRRPTLSLIIPAATLVNAIFFHILPTVLQRRVSPGLYPPRFSTCRSRRGRSWAHGGTAYRLARWPWLSRPAPL